MKKINPRSNQFHANLSDLEQTENQPDTPKSTSLIMLTKTRINRWAAVRFGLAVFVLLCLFTIMLSSRSFAASEVPQASISLEDMESGELLLRAGNDLSSAILLSTDVKIHIAGTISRTIVSQRFINTGETWAKGVYVFPIGATAAVDTLKMRIGDRFIEGQIKEKKAAKKAYQTAKKSVAHRAEEAQFIHQHNCEYWSRRDCYSSD